MLIRFSWILFLTIFLFLIAGCSTPASQERLDTILCWFRSSCLPSQPKTAKPPPIKIASKPSPALPKSKPLKNPPLPNPPSLRCVTSTKATIQAVKPSVIVSYVEPTTKANGQALTNLAKTTIYQDLGKGFVKYKDIRATTPEGGGTIQETIHYTIRDGTSIETTICVTATNTLGQER